MVVQKLDSILALRKHLSHAYICSSWCLNIMQGQVDLKDIKVSFSCSYYCMYACKEKGKRITKDFEIR